MGKRPYISIKKKPPENKLQFTLGKQVVEAVLLF